jgi:hypothetical protein
MNLCLSPRNLPEQFGNSIRSRQGHHVTMIIFRADAAAQRPYPFLMVGSYRCDDRPIELRPNSLMRINFWRKNCILTVIIYGKAFTKFGCSRNVDGNA